MKTVNNRAALKNKADGEIKKLKEFWISSEIPLICDLGSNIGYYTESFINHFSESTIHAYEPHPYNIEKFKTFVKSDKVILHEYGLFNKDTELIIGLPNHAKDNNGCYSIKHTHNGIKVKLRKADKQEIRPDIVKIDVEGAEPQILECAEFFKNTKLILIEMLYKDDMNINEEISERLLELGYTYKLNTSKNNQLWLK
jgi:FkbM family methyltransferase